MTRSVSGTPDKGVPPELTANREPFATYAEAVDWINARVPVHGIRQGLERMERFMELLDHPERRLRFIHVAGTNGKGSTCAFLTEALMANGYDVGTFTSPYIEKFTNRLQYNNRDIPEEELLRLTNRLLPVIAEMEGTEIGAPTMFEIVTTIAILYFATTVFPDFVVWEAGLGGKRDCTTIVNPIISIITNVGLDHMDILGDSIGEIAAEKAGIVKPGVPVVSGADHPDAIREIEHACSLRQAKLYLLDREYRFAAVPSANGRQTIDFHSPFKVYRNMEVGLAGFHQAKNASAALMALEILRQYGAVLLEEEQLRSALAAARWPGRLELLQEEPRLLIDGAHNPHAALALSQTIGEFAPYTRLHLMLGMISTKDHQGFLSHLLPLADTVIITEPDYHKKLPAGELFRQAEEWLARFPGHRPVVTLEPDWKKALEKLLDETGKDDLALVTGTLYMISDVRSWVIGRSESEKGW